VQRLGDELGQRPAAGIVGPLLLDLYQGRSG
jgi:hypothetical protein